MADINNSAVISFYIKTTTIKYNCNKRERERGSKIHSICRRKL